MSNEVKLLALVKCANYECQSNETVPASLSAHIGDGGRIDINIEPDYPETWCLVRSHMCIDGAWLDHGDTIYPMCAVSVRAQQERKNIEDAQTVASSKRQGKRNR